MSDPMAIRVGRCSLLLPGLVMVLASLACSIAGAEATNSVNPPPDYELRVGDRPVIQRGFMPESSPRSIAVGLPGGVSYCFDAESCRLRYAWNGGFLNMKPTWEGRGAAPPALTGEKFFIGPASMPLRLGDRTSAPTAKFLGYALVNGLPEFQFKVDGIAVKERIESTRDGGLRCAFELSENAKEIWFHVPEGARVSAADRDLEANLEGWAKIPRGRGVITHFDVSIPGPAGARPIKTAAGTSSNR